MRQIIIYHCPYRGYGPMQMIVIDESEIVGHN